MTKASALQLQEDEMTDRPTAAEVLADLSRARAAFQLRTIEAILRERPAYRAPQENADD